MLEQYIDKYTKYQNDNASRYENHITFLLVDDKYHMFYNEKSSINANNLPINIFCDGILQTKEDIYFYTIFDESKKKHTLEMLKNYNITILDKKFHSIEFYKTNERRNDRIWGNSWY